MGYNHQNWVNSQPGAYIQPANGMGQPGPGGAMPQPMSNVRQQQLQQLCQFFPNVLVIGRNQMGEEYRIPLMLSRAKQALYVRVFIPYMFPQMAPQIVVMHRVTHEKISKDGRYAYIGDRLTKWNVYSNLQNLVRQMHQEFEMNPPISEGAVNQPPAGGVHQPVQPSSSNVEVSEPVVDPEEGKEVEAFVRREESERSEFAQK